MPGEQLSCTLQAIRALDGSKTTDNIPKGVLQAIFHSLKTAKFIDYSNEIFDSAFSSSTEITFESIKNFIHKSIPSVTTSSDVVYEHIEVACWNMSKNTYSAPLSETDLEKLWKISNRLIDERCYPPKIAKEDCDWFTAKLTANLGGHWNSHELSFPENGLDFQSLIDILCDTYLSKTGRTEVEACIEEIHCWLVSEIIKEGWLMRRIRKQANWTSWSRQWFILKPQRLQFMDKSATLRKLKSNKGMSEIDVKRHTKVSELPPYQGIIYRHDYRFRVSNLPIVECELAAVNEAEKSSWISSLREAISASKENLSPVQRLLKNRHKNDGEKKVKAEAELDRLYKKTVKLRKMEKSVTSEQSVQNKSSSRQFEEQELQKIKTIFMKIDANGDGVLSRVEFSSFMVNLGLKMTENEIDLVFKSCDTDHNGKVDFQEFTEYFAKHILGENGTGKCVAALRRAFLKADRDGSGTLTFKEFAEYVWERHRSVRISQLLNTFDKMSTTGKDEISFQEFHDILSTEKDSLSVLEQDPKEGALEQQLKCAFDETEVKEMAEYIRNRWQAFATFRRKGARGKTVMKGGHGMVADFVPGEYSLVDLACFSDLPPLIPKHTVIKNVTWETSTIRGKSGKIIFPSDFNGKVVTDVATNELLRFYDCSFADTRQEKISLLYRHGIQDFTYENEYLSDYVKATNGGCGIEKHEFSHLDCPLDEESGIFVLAKLTDDNELLVTGFKVPIRHTLYIPGGSIHSNDYLAGTWRTMLSDEVDIDHVHLTKRDSTGNLEHFSFEFQ